MRIRSTACLIRSLALWALSMDLAQSVLIFSIRARSFSLLWPVEMKVCAGIKRNAADKELRRGYKHVLPSGIRQQWEGTKIKPRRNGNVDTGEDLRLNAAGFV